MLKIQKRRLGEPEVPQPERVLIIVELPPDYAAPEFDVVTAPGPGQRALFLKHIIDVEDGNEPVVPESETAAHSPHRYDVDRCEPRNLVTHVRVRHPEFLAGIGALIRGGCVKPEPGEGAFRFHHHRGADDVNVIHHETMRIRGRGTRVDSAARADFESIHGYIGK